MLTPTTLTTAARIARQKLPAQTNGRLERAMELVQAGMVWPPDRPGASWLVQSSDDKAVFYMVNGSCSCPDAKHNAPLGLCKHRLAVWLYKKRLALETPASQVA